MSKSKVKPGQRYYARCEMTHPQFTVLAVNGDVVECEFHYQCGSREGGIMTLAEIEASYALRTDGKRNGKI